MELINEEALNNFLQVECDYIILNDDKTPKNSIKDLINHKKFEYVASENSLGIILKNDWVVIDIDNKDNTQSASKMIELIDYYGWVCNIMQTTRGMHFWFKKSDENIKNAVDIVLPVGIKADVKTSGHNAYVVIKKDGKFRQWLRFNDKVDKLPLELTPISNKAFQNLECPVNLQQGSRRDNLFKRITTLASAHWSIQRTFNLLHTINKILFATPLSESEVENTLQGSERFFNDEELGGFFELSSDGKTLKLNVFKVADYVLHKYKIVRYGDQLFFFDEVEQIYKLRTEREILTIIKQLLPETLSQKLREICTQIRISPLIKNKTPEKNIVALQNCYYNLNTFSTLQPDENLFVINKINVIYEENALAKYKARTLNKFFNDITSKNKDNIQILLEFIGYCLTSDTRFQKALLIYGQTASNGKSTFFELLTYFFGINNASFLSFEELPKRFSTSALLDKMINIGADISSEYVQEPSTFKKLVTGDPITTEFKGQDKFSFKNKAKFIFAANKLPPSQDKSEGYYRRFLIVPFDNKFTKERRNLDRNILDKLCTPENMSVLFLLVIKAYKNLILNGDFTKSEVAEIISREYIKSNNSINIFIENDIEHTDEQIQKGVAFINETVTEKYLNYKNFCTEFGYKVCSLSKFKEEVLLYFKSLNLTTRKKKIDDSILEVFTQIIQK